MYISLHENLIDLSFHSRPSHCLLLFLMLETYSRLIWTPRGQRPRSNESKRERGKDDAIFDQSPATSAFFQVSKRRLEICYYRRCLSMDKKREKNFCKAFQDPRGLVKNLFLKRYLEGRLLGPSQRLGHKNRLKVFKIFERLVKNLGLDQEEQLQLDFATLCFTLAAIVAFRWAQESPSSPETVFRWSSKVSNSTADSGWEF